MTVAQFSIAVGADVVWIANTRRLLKLGRARSLVMARRLTLVRVLHAELGLGLVESNAAGERALHDGEKLIRTSRDGSLELSLDLDRFESTFIASLSAARTLGAPRRRGRPPTAERDPLKAAVAFGIDLSLLRWNLAQRPADRLRSLDANAQALNEMRGAR